ncbi:MAG: FKBP-type peptidyl-prolyl cis-trans isomerase [Candidatus Levyibacteriota bacterium]
MNKQFLLAVIAGIIVLIGFGYFVFHPMSNSSTQEATTTTNQTNTATQGLKIKDEKVGTGAGVKSGDTVVINYTGTLTNGKKFDSSYDHGQPFTTQIGVGQVIKGWDEGVIGMKVGGKRKLMIPPSLGYGDQATGNIPPNSTLIFEVELEGIK